MWGQGMFKLKKAERCLYMPFLHTQPKQNKLNKSIANAELFYIACKIIVHIYFKHKCTPVRRRSLEIHMGNEILLLQTRPRFMQTLRLPQVNTPFHWTWLYLKQSYQYRFYRLWCDSAKCQPVGDILSQITQPSSCSQRIWGVFLWKVRPSTETLSWI